MPALTAHAIGLHLKAVPHWKKRARTIRRTFEFEGFLEGIALVNRVAKRAQKLNHHPDIDIRFSKVTLTLTTHDGGGLTEKDFTLARQREADFSKLGVALSRFEWRVAPGVLPTGLGEHERNGQHENQAAQP